MAVQVNSILQVGRMCGAADFERPRISKPDSCRQVFRLGFDDQTQVCRPKKVDWG